MVFTRKLIASAKILIHKCDFYIKLWFAKLMSW